MKRYGWYYVIALTSYENVRAFSTAPTAIHRRLFQHHHPPRSSCEAPRSTTITSRYTTTLMALFNFSKSAKIPSSTRDRDAQAIDAVKSAIQKPRNPSMPLIECEFPALAALNKLGDGSLRSTLEAEQANLSFVSNLVKSLAPVPFLGPRVSVFTSSSASKSLLASAKSKIQGRATVLSLKEDIVAAQEEMKKGDVSIFLTPSSRLDYQAAERLASSGSVSAVVIVNGFAKDPKSVPGTATMAYYLKPLTYNSQIAGYLLRNYPADWTVLDAVTNQALATFSDGDILVRGTNTPDLRGSGRLVQRSTDERAIRERSSR